MTGQRTFEHKLGEFISENREVIGIPHANCVIYFIRRGRFIKIGKTRSFSMRMRTLNGGTNTPPGFDDIELLAVDVDDARHSKERCLHEMFKWCRAGGEWFHDHHTLMQLIAATASPEGRRRRENELRMDRNRNRKRYCDCAARAKRAERECPTCGHEPKYHDENACAVFDNDMRRCECPGFEGLDPRLGQTILAA